MKNEEFEKKNLKNPDFSTLSCLHSPWRKDIISHGVYRRAIDKDIDFWSFRTLFRNFLMTNHRVGHQFPSANIKFVQFEKFKIFENPQFRKFRKFWKNEKIRFRRIKFCILFLSDALRCLKTIGTISIITFSWIIITYLLGVNDHYTQMFRHWHWLV